MPQIHLARAFTASLSLGISSVRAEGEFRPALNMFNESPPPDADSPPPPKDEANHRRNLDRPAVTPSLGPHKSSWLQWLLRYGITLALIFSLSAGVEKLVEIIVGFFEKALQSEHGHNTATHAPVDKEKNPPNIAERMRRLNASFVDSVEHLAPFTVATVFYNYLWYGPSLEEQPYIRHELDLHDHIANQFQHPDIPNPQLPKPNPSTPLLYPSTLQDSIKGPTSLYPSSALSPNPPQSNPLLSPQSTLHAPPLNDTVLNMGAALRTRGEFSNSIELPAQQSTPLKRFGPAIGYTISSIAKSGNFGIAMAIVALGFGVLVLNSYHVKLWPAYVLLAPLIGGSLLCILQPIMWLSGKCFAGFIAPQITAAFSALAASIPLLIVKEREHFITSKVLTRWFGNH